MSNIGEEIIYWYLRLNGFFPISNFVIHDKIVGGRGETDFLAIKPSFAREVVDKEELDFDTNLFDLLEMDREEYLSKIIFFMAEVSLSKKSKMDVREKFSENIVKYDLQRLGIDNLDGIEKLMDSPFYEKDNCYIAKFFFSPNKIQSDVAYVFPYYGARTFVKNRMKNAFKRLGWDLIPSNVIQDMIKKDK